MCVGFVSSTVVGYIPIPMTNNVNGNFSGFSTTIFFSLWRQRLLSNIGVGNDHLRFSFEVHLKRLHFLYCVIVNSLYSSGAVHASFPISAILQFSQW